MIVYTQKKATQKSRLQIWVNQLSCFKSSSFNCIITVIIIANTEQGIDKNIINGKKDAQSGKSIFLSIKTERTTISCNVRKIEKLIIKEA